MILDEEMMTYLVLEFHEFSPVLSSDLRAQLIPTHIVPSYHTTNISKKEEKKFCFFKISV